MHVEESVPPLDDLRIFQSPDVGDILPPIILGVLFHKADRHKRKPSRLLNHSTTEQIFAHCDLQLRGYLMPLGSYGLITFQIWEVIHGKQLQPSQI